MGKNLTIRTQPKTSRRRWSRERRVHAHELRAGGMALAAIAVMVDMSLRAVTDELAGIRPVRVQRSREPSGRLHFEYVRQPPSEALFDARARRLEAADKRTFTQAFLGDPPPGFAARDGKVGMT